MFTARYGLIPYIQQIAFRLLNGKHKRRLSSCFLLDSLQSLSYILNSPPVKQGMAIYRVKYKQLASDKQSSEISVKLNPLNTELNPICHLLTLLGAHHIVHVSRVRVNVPVSQDFSFSAALR